MSRPTTDTCIKIEIWWILRDINAHNGYKDCTVSWGDGQDRRRITLRLSVRDGWDKAARFIYTLTDSYTGDKKDFDYSVPIIETPCHFGGSRYWFECNLYKNGMYCGRRVGILYKAGDWFGCRHCYNLAYSSQTVNRRYAHYPLFRTLELRTQMEKLKAKTHRNTYKGAATKKQQRLMRLAQQAVRSYRRFESADREI